MALFPWPTARRRPTCCGRPSSVLPSKACGPPRACFRATPQPIAFDLTLDQNGAVVQVVGQRWSNANPEQAFRLQPFGGSVEAEATFGGFTIPAILKVGNHFGTGDYFPFFQAEILSAVYQ